MNQLESSKIVDTYRQRTKTSAKLASRARGVFPSGVTHDGRYLLPYPIYVDRASGSRKWDVDGNEYVDYAGGHGALLLGHNPPEIIDAVSQQLAQGTHYGACHELEIRWGELVQEMVPSAGRVRFTSSGTEATLLAMRLARAFTGRNKIMHFTGHFHGWHDHVAFGVNNHFDGSPSPGVLPGVADGIVLAPAGDLETAIKMFKQHDIAAVIVEPTGASWGQVPISPDFLAKLREATAEHGVLLLFDEVISGFRCSPGGAQQVFGITPDMTTLAKILAGGFPGGAVVGREEILQLISFPEAGQKHEKISHHGTFNANPVSAAAGIACLDIVRSTDACEKANQYAQRLRDELNQVLQEESVPWLVYGTFSGFHILVAPEDTTMTPAAIESCQYDYRVLKARPRPDLVLKLRLGMMVHGVELFGWPGGPTSAVHSDEDLDRTITAFRSTLGMLKEEDPSMLAAPSASA